MHNDSEFMRASDAFSWYQEADPALRSTIVGVAWLDQPPVWPVLRARMDAATRLIPRFRQRVEELPARLAPPRWVIDEGFDLSWHLRKVAAPQPRTAASALELARMDAMTGFDRARPLWVFTLVEGLAGDRAALIMKVHHSLTDGQGAVKLTPFVFDRQRTPRARTRTVPPPTAARRGLAVAGLAHNVNRAIRVARRGILGAVPAGLHVLRDPLGSIRAVVDTVASIGATVAPVREPLSPVMRGRGLGRQLELVTVDLADLKRAATAGGATVNDAFLAGITGGMRRYHQLHGARADQLRVTMPISIRTETDSWASNRITLMRFTLPVAEPDPVTRMRQIDHRARQVRQARSLGFTDAIAGGLDLLPPAAAGSLLKKVDFLASDVIGMPNAIYLAGAKVTGYAAFGPTMGCSANLTMMSYDGACHIGITLDSAAVPDAEDFVECLRAGFEEVAALAGQHGGVRVPIRDGEFPGSHRPEPVERSPASTPRAAGAAMAQPRKPSARTRPAPPESS
jgi:WS/DGAT/MGAT family acyltransferase